MVITLMEEAKKPNESVENSNMWISKCQVDELRTPLKKVKTRKTININK